MEFVSITPHVRVSAKRSPTRTAGTPVRHQHRIGSVSTSPGRGPAEAGCAYTGAPVPPVRAASARTHHDVFISHLPKAAFGREFHERRFHFPSIEAHADDIEVRFAGRAHDRLLPLVDAGAHSGQLTARKDLC